MTSTNLIKNAFFSLVVVMTILYGLAGIWIGAPQVLQWASLSARTLAYYGVSLLAGLALLICGALSLRAAWRKPAALGGLAAAAVLLLNQYLGLKFQAILCFTPS